MPFVAGNASRMVFLVHEHHVGLVRGRLFGVQLGIGHDDDLVALLGAARGRPVEAHDAAPTLARDGVGGKALAVVYVRDLYALVLQNVSRIQQILVHSDGPHVIEVGLRNRGTVNLALQHGDCHYDASPSRVRFPD